MLLYFTLYQQKLIVYNNHNIKKDFKMNNIVSLIMLSLPVAIPTIVIGKNVYQQVKSGLPIDLIIGHIARSILSALGGFVIGAAICCFVVHKIAPGGGADRVMSAFLCGGGVGSLIGVVL